MSGLMYVSDLAGRLISIDPLTLSAKAVGTTSLQLTDIAFSPTGELFGITFTGLYKIDASTAKATFVGSLGISGANALAFNSSGEAYVARSDSAGLYSVNTSTGRASLIGQNSLGMYSSGDLLWIGNDLYLSTTDNRIAKIDAATGEVVSSAYHGINNLYGLGSVGGVIYGFADNVFYRINPENGAFTRMASVAGSGTLSGAATMEFLDDDGSAKTLVGGNDGDWLFGGAGADRLFGNFGDDRLYGEAGNDSLQGGEENDILAGGSGRDVLNGGAGNDVYVLEGDDDVVIDSAGVDTITSTISRSLVNYASIDNLALLGTRDINGQGNNLNNVITGNVGNNVLNGGDGNDALRGLAGNDTLDGRAGADYMTGGAGDDTYVVDAYTDFVNEVLDGGAGTDKIISYVSFDLSGSQVVGDVETLQFAGTASIHGKGNGLNNILAGNAGANVLSGMNGNDVLAGGLGNDTLTGGAGMDVFLFNTTLNSTTNVDTITDFSVADDMIRLAKSIYATIAGTGTLSANQFVSNTTGLAGDADDRIIYESDTGKLFYDTNGSAAGGYYFQIATMAPGLSLTNADFFLV